MLVSAFLGLSVVIDGKGPARLIAIVVAVFLVTVAVRGLRLGEITVDTRRVSVRGTVRNRTFQLSKITGAEVRPMMLMFNSRPHRILVIVRKDGRRIPVRLANARIRDSEPTTWVDQAAAYISGVVR